MTSTNATKSLDAVHTLNEGDTARPPRTYNDSDLHMDRHYGAQAGDVITSFGRSHLVSEVVEYAHPWPDIPNPMRIVKCADGWGITAIGPVPR